MKKLFLTAMVASAFLFSNAQNGMQEKDSKTKKESMKGKEHACTTACKDGKHMYAHGEKGHTCTKECHKKK